jgi:hypothetical protein
MGHEAARRLSQEFELPMVMDMRDPWSLVDRMPESIASPLAHWLARRYERWAVCNARW